uniref:non-specific serine/threonine protein kinase n=1 Tax=Timema cristinae TaxID=61476 RepID=A0A7R9D249_TIMCR|nr:unnamed protein product [Timema cristinae]
MKRKVLATSRVFETIITPELPLTWPGGTSVSVSGQACLEPQAVSWSKALFSQLRRELQCGGQSTRSCVEVHQGVLYIEGKMNDLGLRSARTPKSTPITEDYEISNTVLGLGINGKVVQCYSKKSGEKYALKARREVDLHWRASGCRHIVNIVDVYENTYRGNKCLLVVMEW